MKNRIYDVLKDIKAEEQLKNDTLRKLYATKKEKPSKSLYKMALSTCTVLILVLFMGMFSYNYYFAENGYIDIDVNPSIQLTINRLNKVIDAYAYNVDGEEILDELSLKHKSYDEAVAEIIERLQNDGYLQEEGLLSATITTDWKAESRLGRLEEIVSYFLQETSYDPKHEVYVIDSITKKHAHEEGVTPAKYLAIQELQKVAPETKVEDCKNHSISEIRKETYEHEEQKHRQENEELKHGQENSGASLNQNNDGANHEQKQNHEQDNQGANHNQEQEHNQGDQGANHNQQQQHNPEDMKSNHQQSNPQPKHQSGSSQSKHQQDNNQHQSKSNHGDKKRH